MGAVGGLYLDGGGGGLCGNWVGFGLGVRGGVDIWGSVGDCGGEG